LCAFAKIAIPQSVKMKFNVLGVVLYRVSYTVIIVMNPSTYDMGIAYPVDNPILCHIGMHMK
jgi:hypothetical protein